jgi:predicted RNase H-like nuclease (RuvC/YqgF family)
MRFNIREVKEFIKNFPELNNTEIAKELGISRQYVGYTRELLEILETQDQEEKLKEFKDRNKITKAVYNAYFSDLNMQMETLQTKVDELKQKLVIKENIISNLQTELNKTKQNCENLKNEYISKINDLNKHFKIEQQITWETNTQLTQCYKEQEYLKSKYKKIKLYSILITISFFILLFYK